MIRSRSVNRSNSDSNNATTVVCRPDALGLPSREQ